MPRRPSTGFDRYFKTRMKDPEFASEYEAARAEIDAIDAVVRALDAARLRKGLSKAALAKRVDMKPEVVRRLFTADSPNPTLETVVKLATALDCRLGIAPVAAPRAPSSREARR